MSNRDKYEYIVVSRNESNQSVSADFVFQFVVDFNSFLKSADINIKSNKLMVHMALGFFVVGLFLIKFFL